MTYYRRGELSDADRLLAGAVGVAVGAIAFYVARIWLQREVLDRAPPKRPAGEVSRAEAAGEGETAKRSSG